MRRGETLAHDGPRSRGALIASAVMLIALPLVAIQGPFHTTPMDAVNGLFVAIYWAVLLARRERIEMPLLVPFWVIMVASLTASYDVPDGLRATITVVEDVYLYIWFVTLVHFLSHRCRVREIGMMWVVVACAVAFLTLGDAHFGLFGGRFAGTTRATGTFENPNMFGDYLVVSLFAAWAVAAGGQRLAYLALPLLFAGVLATASNGCLVSVIAGVGTVVIAHRSFWKPRQLGAVLLAGGVLFGTVAAFYDQIQEAAMERFSGGRSEVGGAAAKGASERLPIWENLIVQVMQRPLGVGPGGFADINAETTGDHHAAHSEYLGMLAERGFIGFAGWLGVMGGILLMVRRIAAASSVGYRPFGVPQTYGLFGAMAAHALVIELSHFRHTWLIFAVLAAAAAQATARTADAEPVVLREAA